MLGINEFVDFYSKQNDLSKTKSRAEILRFVNSYKNATIECGGVNINGFAKSMLVDIPCRKSRNPTTGEPIDVPAKKIVKIKISSKFKNTEV